MRTARSVSLAATSSVAAIPSTTTAISWATVFLIGSRPLRIASRPKTWKHQCRRPRERARHAGYRHGPDQVTRPPSGEWNVGSSRHRAPVLREGRESVNIHTNSGFSRGMSGEHAMKVQAYLSFEGRCEEAIIEFYKRVLGAEVLMVMRFKDTPEPPSPGMIAPGSENNILTSPGDSHRGRASRRSRPHRSGYPESRRKRRACCDGRHGGRRLQSGAGVDAMTTTQSIARKVAKWRRFRRDQP